MAKTCGVCEKSVQVGGTFSANGNVINCRCGITGKNHPSDHPCDVPEKPRLCEVLDVAVGERFYFDDQGEPFGPLVIRENGQLERDDFKGIFPHVRFLADAINHPDKIIRVPRLTDKERGICRVLGAKWVSRDKSGDLVCLWAPGQAGDGRSGGRDLIAWIQGRFFPSVQPGQWAQVVDEP